VTDGGHNLIGVASPGSSFDCGFANGTGGDVTGSPSSPLDPHLGALANNGGPTQTEALLSGSPAIRAGGPVDCQAAPVSGKDQRGDNRATAGRFACDIGAYDTGGAGHAWYVSASAKSDPACSAASASNPFHTIAAALACAGSGDTVNVGAGAFAGGFTVAANVVLNGAGANRTTITDAASLGTTPELTVAPTVSPVIENLAVNGANKNAGIVTGSGSLLVQKVGVLNTFETSPSEEAPLAVLPNPGTAAVTVLGSTFSGNFGYESGAIAVFGEAIPSIVSVFNSTLANNQAFGHAGGIYVGHAGLTARDDTITGNLGQYGGGLYLGMDGTATVTDSLIATNTLGAGGPADAVDCGEYFGGKVTDGGHNLIGVTSPGSSFDCGFVNGANGDVTGSPASPLNPQLGALANNGGPTQTEALLSGSPAIGAGGAADCQAAPVSGKDQRGSARNAAARSACDIGAYDTGGAT
jgi:hypothetical protein